MGINLFESLCRVMLESVETKPVIDAIQNRYRVKIKYSDEHNNAPGQRIIEPYAFGLSKSGNPVLRAFQYNGDSLRGIPQWKLFRLDRITSWIPTKSVFELQPNEQGYGAPNYNENGDKAMSNVIAQVKFDKNEELYQPSLDRLRKQTKMLKTAEPMSLRKLEQMPRGPIKQRKQNVYTSQPNSKKYDMIRKNIENTQNERNKADYWADYDKAYQETQNQSGPLNYNNEKELENNVSRN